MRRPDPSVLRLLLFSGSLVGLVVILLVFRRIFLPLLLGFVIAYLFDPAVSWFERRGRSRVFGVVVIALVLLVVLSGFFLYLVPQMTEQVHRLAEHFPEYRNRAQEQLAPWLERLRARYPQQMVELQERSLDWLKANTPRLLGSVGAWLAGFFTSLLSAVLFLLNLVFIPVFAFYLLVDFPKIRQRARELIPLPYRELTLARVAEVDQALSSFLRGQLTIALVLAAINATGLMLLGVPLGLVIGLVAGLANMVPYMSIVVGLIPALLLSWVEHGSLLNLLGVLAVFTAAQLLEGTYLSPRILGKSVNLHPVWVLLSIIVGGSLFGFFGMLIAVPLAAVIHVFVHHWLASYRESRIYRGEAPEAGSVPAPEAD